MKIKRTKTGVSGPDRLPPSTAVGWACHVDPQGCVDAWTTDEFAAADFDAATCELVREHYADKPNAGTITFIGEGQPGYPAPAPSAEDMRAALDEIKRQSAEIETLRRDLEAATAPAPPPAPPPVPGPTAHPTTTTTFSSSSPEPEHDDDDDDEEPAKPEPKPERPRGIRGSRKNEES